MENERPIETKKYWKWWQWLLIIVCVIVFLGIIGSACNTKKEKPTAPAVQEQSKDTSLKRGDCLKEADANFQRLWDDACTARDLEKDCLLPPLNADSLGEILKENHQDCWKLSP